MLTMLSRNWWVFILRGLIAVFFGALALVWPLITLTTLILLFGAFVLADGLFSLIAGISSYGQRERWWAEVLEGIVSILFGVLTFIWPQTTALVLLNIIAAWAVITGILEVAAAIRLRKEITGEWIIFLSGIVSIAFGVVLVLFPGTGAVSLISVIGAYSILFGGLLIVFGFRLWSIKREIEKSSSPSLY